jgi:hypothetical protein
MRVSTITVKDGTTIYLLALGETMGARNLSID